MENGENIFNDMKIDNEAKLKYRQLNKKDSLTIFEKHILNRFNDEVYRYESRPSQTKSANNLQKNRYSIKGSTTKSKSRVDTNRPHEDYNEEKKLCHVFQDEDEQKLLYYRKTFGTDEYQTQYMNERHNFFNNYLSKEKVKQYPNYAVRSSKKKLNKSQDIEIYKSRKSSCVRRKTNTPLTTSPSQINKLQEGPFKRGSLKVEQTIEQRKQILAQKKKERIKKVMEEQKFRQEQYQKEELVLIGKDERIQPHFSHLNFENNYEFPKWVSDRKEFHDLQQSKYFNLNLKLISICEIDSYKRDDSQKTMVGLYLQKLSLFKLMPFDMLMEIAGRLTSAHYPKGSIICKQGDPGDCMYIIYRGEIDVQVFGKSVKIFFKNEHLGRNALEEDTPRTASLIANLDCDLLLLSRWDFQHCLSNIFKIERPKWISFIDSIGFFKNFSKQKITKLCDDLKGRFLSQKDCLYKNGAPIDNIYIVKNGTLVKTVVVDLEKHNRWPSRINEWMQRSLTTKFEIAIKYPPQTILGFYELITAPQNVIPKRQETIDAYEDCFVLYVSRSKFLEIFDQDDLERFKNHYIKNNPTSFDHLVNQLKTEEDKKKKELKVVVDAVMTNLVSCPNNIVDYKRNKYQKVIDSAQKKFIQFQDQKTIKGMKERIQDQGLNKII